MKKLIFEGLDLSTNKKEDVILSASNFFMLFWKFQVFMKRVNIAVLNWEMEAPDYHAGSSHPYNAEAYLWDCIDELEKNMFNLT